MDHLTAPGHLGEARLAFTDSCALGTELRQDDFAVLEALNNECRGSRHLFALLSLISATPMGFLARRCNERIVAQQPEARRPLAIREVLSELLLQLYLLFLHRQLSPSERKRRKG